MKQKVNILEIMGGRGTFTGATMKSAGEENVNIVGYIEADMNNAKNKNNKYNIKYKGNNCIGVYNARFGKFNYYKPKDVNYFRFEEIKDIVHIAFVSYPSYTFDRDNQDSNLEKLPNSIHNAMQILRPWCVVIDYTYTSKDENEVFLFMQHIQEFEKLGYDIFIDNYNAKDFDVPQNRERVCVVLFLKYAIDSSEFTFPRKTPTNKTCWDLIDKEYSKDLEFTEKQVEYMLNPEIKVGFKSRPLTKDDIYFPTISANIGPNQGWTPAIEVDKENRIYRIPKPIECYRAQGLSDNAYYFDEKACNYNKNALYSLAGNSTIGKYAIECMKQIFRLKELRLWEQ